LNQVFLIEENLRIVKRLWKVDKTSDFPQGQEFSIQLLQQLAGYWIQIARIDNQKHKRKPGVHIHKLNGFVIWEDMTFKEAVKRISNIAQHTRR